MTSRKIKLYALATLIIMFAAYSAWWDEAHAEELDAQLRPVKITGYCLKGIMKNGEETREGVCAYRPQDIGKVAVVYNEDMELIGTFEICDTGKKSIRDGYVLDIWQEEEKDCYELTQDGFVQVLDAEG
jgi:hypothetical protein